MKLIETYRGRDINELNGLYMVQLWFTYTTELKDGDWLVVKTVQEARELVDHLRLERTLRLMARS